MEKELQTAVASISLVLPCTLHAFLVYVRSSGNKLLPSEGVAPGYGTLSWNCFLFEYQTIELAWRSLVRPPLVGQVGFISFLLAFFFSCAMKRALRYQRGILTYTTVLFFFSMQALLYSRADFFSDRCILITLRDWLGLGCVNP